MAYPLTHTTAELLDTLALSTINSMASNSAWMVDNMGEKLIRLVGQRGGIDTSVNDADAVEHPLTVGDDSAWTYYRGSREASGSQAMGAGTLPALSQKGVFSVARSTLLDAASNFVVPEDLIGRPVQNALNVMEKLLERHLRTFFREQESYIVIGDALTAGVTPTTAVPLAPYLTDTDFAAGGTDYSQPSFSLLGLMISGTAAGTGDQYGDMSAEGFMGVSEDTDSEWVPTQDITATKTALATNGQTVYEKIQSLLIEVGRYGGQEMVTDWMCPTDMYEEILKYMRTLSVNNDVLLNNLATTSAIPIAGTMLDYHHFLVADTSYDVGRTANDTYDTISPLFGLNLNSLKLNLPNSGSGDQWLKQVSGFETSELKTWLFKRMHARHAWSLAQGRRSFVYCDRFKTN